MTIHCKYPNTSHHLFGCQHARRDDRQILGKMICKLQPFGQCFFQERTTIYELNGESTEELSRRLEGK